ncbi:MAG: D-alanyl-D-alanine carboxypeptidase family protein, partial [Clostridia bacterium]|nr:D-alanyl-D-alanine carboxypeptidase family protein [Clostridia bacterium]
AENGTKEEMAYKWLSDNAHKYGFILRYPSDKTDITGIAYEPWHFRYVGKSHAKEIYNQGLCLEEYVETL